MLTGGTPITIAVLCTTVQHSVTQISHSRYSIPGNMPAHAVRATHSSPVIDYSTNEQRLRSAGVLPIAEDDDDAGAIAARVPRHRRPRDSRLQGRCRRSATGASTTLIFRATAFSPNGRDRSSRGVVAGGRWFKSGANPDVPLSQSARRSGTWCESAEIHCGVRRSLASLTVTGRSNPRVSDRVKSNLFMFYPSSINTR